MNVRPLLEKLKIALRSGALTPATKVDGGTFVCLKETNNKGEITNYFQACYEALPDHWQTAFKHKQKGDIIKNTEGTITYKVLAVYDAWNEEEKSA